MKKDHAGSHAAYMKAKAMKVDEGEAIQRKAMKVDEGQRSQDDVADKEVKGKAAKVDEGEGSNYDVTMKPHRPCCSLHET